MGSLLFDEHPLVIQPSVAKLLGLNEAIFLQQLNYWLQKSDHFFNGHKWVYNTYQGWQEQFPFWSSSTIRRIIRKLEESGILLTANYNCSKIDNTKWYSIDREKLESMKKCQSEQAVCEKQQTSDQNEQVVCSDQADGLVNLDKPIPEITSETTSEINDDVDNNAHEHKPSISEFYQQNMGVLTPVVAEDISLWIDGHHFDEPNDIVIEAIRIAVKNGVRKWSYVNKILLDWRDHNLRTMQQVRAYSLEFEERGKHEKSNHQPGRVDPVVPKPITKGEAGFINKPANYNDQMLQMQGQGWLPDDII